MSSLLNAMIVIVPQFLFQTFQNYDLEPTIPSSEVSSDSDKGNSDNEEEKERIGNTNWCVCGEKCSPMEMYTESLCCRETNEVPDDYFHDDFKSSLFLR